MQSIKSAWKYTSTITCKVTHMERSRKEYRVRNRVFL